MVSNCPFSASPHQVRQASSSCYCSVVPWCKQRRMHSSRKEEYQHFVDGEEFCQKIEKAGNDNMRYRYHNYIFFQNHIYIYWKNSGVFVLFIIFSISNFVCQKTFIFFFQNCIYIYQKNLGVFVLLLIFSISNFVSQKTFVFFSFQNPLSVPKNRWWTDHPGLKTLVEALKITSSEWMIKL